MYIYAIVPLLESLKYTALRQGGIVLAFTEQEVAVLQQMAYMDDMGDLTGRELRDIASDLLQQREGALRRGGRIRTFGHWGDFTTEEHYAMLQAIEDGKYPGISNLVFKSYLNDSGKTGFVACAFQDKKDPQKTVFSFRGSRGNTGRTNDVW